MLGRSPVRNMTGAYVSSACKVTAFQVPLAALQSWALHEEMPSVLENILGSVEIELDPPTTASCINLVRVRSFTAYKTQPVVRKPRFQHHEGQHTRIAFVHVPCLHARHS